MGDKHKYHTAKIFTVFYFQESIDSKTITQRYAVSLISSTHLAHLCFTLQALKGMTPLF